MRCPSCGAVIKKRSMKCPECGAFRNKSWVSSPSTSEGGLVAVAPTQTTKTERDKSSPSLIAFPGVTRTSVPEWRKELGERVREVQEKRARDATTEGVEDGSSQSKDTFTTTPQLELLPQAELQPMNPIVAAALERIERAYVQPQSSGNVAVATVANYDQHPDVGHEVSPSNEDGLAIVSAENKVTGASLPPEKIHNLAVVPSPPQQVAPPGRPKPKRLIREDLNDPALNYLDSLPTTVGVDIRANHSAPILARFFSGIVDLVIVSLLASPAVALVELKELDWLDWRVVTFAAGTFVIMGFLYLTISIALTGRTLGMRLLSMRVVDARTGLIPTGGQSAWRAFLYMLSLVSAGIALMYTFIDREKRTVHDRFSGTSVVRV
jgi:uncharacterized RDD family membrane protein YckC